MHSKHSGLRNQFSILAATSAVVALAALSTTGGCSSNEESSLGSGGGSNNTGGGSSTSGGSSSTGGGSTWETLPDPVGTLAVTLTPANAETSTAANARLLGMVRDAALVPMKSWKIEQEGDCQLQTPVNPFCDPACPSGQTCVQLGDTGHCVASTPVAKSVGTVTVTGVKTSAGDTTFTMDPTSSLAYQRSDLAYPPFAEGDSIQLKAAGGEYSAFTIDVKGIAPLQTSITSLNLTKDQAANLTWTAAGSSSTASVEIALDISQHGLTKGQVFCRTKDTGSLQISAAMITKLINLGVAGFPTIAITRKARGSANIQPGRVDFLLVSTIEIPVVVAGYRSCNTVEDCDSGQTCTTDYLCQ